MWLFQRPLYGNGLWINQNCLLFTHMSKEMNVFLTSHCYILPLLRSIYYDNLLSDVGVVALNVRYLCTLGTDRQIGRTTTSAHPTTVTVRFSLVPSQPTWQPNTACLQSTCPAVAATRLSFSLQSASHFITLRNVTSVLSIPFVPYC